MSTGKRRDDPARRRLYERTNRAQQFMTHTFERVLLRVLVDQDRQRLSDDKVLDVGCGTGGLLATLESWGAAPTSLFGVELEPLRAQQAAGEVPAANIATGNATDLPFDDGAFDLVLQSMMLTELRDDGQREKAAKEMARVLAPSGLIISYDMCVPSPQNSGVWPLYRAGLTRLFPKMDLLEFHRVALAPPITRRLVPLSHTLTTVAQALRVANTHALAVMARVTTRSETQIPTGRASSRRFGRAPTPAAGRSTARR